MRLLNTTTITLAEFISEPFPDYAILSHRWDESEISFPELTAGQDTLTLKPGWSKIKNCCAKAAEDGWEYVWIDSCCIDKSSSAELSEAINSMFRWYEKGQVCYAYLSDVPNGEENIGALNSAFRRSKWFTRGWTLQELLAPERVVFFDRDWVEIGTKSCLRALLSVITGVNSLQMFREASVAAKMSWASRRETTKLEDKAYCLLGLFGVNMPLLYGEGENAFIRLQLEIIKTSRDESIFAWVSQPCFGPIEARLAGLLASSPFAFRNSGNVQDRQDRARPAYSMTNKGLCIEALLVPNESLDSHASMPTTSFNSSGSFLMPLNCARGLKQLAVYVEELSFDEFVRSSSYLLVELNDKEKGNIGRLRRMIYVRQLTSYSRSRYGASSKISMKTRPLLELGISITEQYVDRKGLFRKQEKWDEDGVDGLNVTLSPEIFNQSAALIFADRGVNAFAVTFHAHSFSEPWINVVLPKEEAFLESVVIPAIAKATENGHFDRISRLLESGKSISVALRKGAMSEESPSVRQYSVEITVDPKGRLRWPEILHVET